MKESRDLADAAKEAERIFNERSAERKTQFDQLNGTATDAKKDLDDNLQEIETLQGQLESDPNNATLQQELETAQDATEGLRTAF